MKIYLIIADGNYTEKINGVDCTADKVEILKASSDHELIKKEMEGSGPVLPNANKWGTTAISVYTIELDLDIDDKWIDALRYFMGDGTGPVPYYTEAETGEVDAYKTIKAVFGLYNINPVAEPKVDTAASDRS